MIKIAAQTENSEHHKDNNWWLTSRNYWRLNVPTKLYRHIGKGKHSKDNTTALLGLQLHEMKQHSIHLSCPKLESYAKKHRRILSEYLESHFGCVGKSDGWCRDAAQFLNCSQLEIPFSYLGIPVGVSSKSWVVWQPIIRKFEAKLAKWKQKCLSQGQTP